MTQRNWQRWHSRWHLRIFIMGLVVLGLAATPMLLLSCSSEQEIALNADGSGIVEAEVSLHPLMVRYIKDIAAGFSASDGASADSDEARDQFRAFDARRVRAAFARIEGAELQHLQLPGEGSLRLSASFRRVNELLPASEGGETTPPIRFTANGSRRTLIVHIDRQNYTAVYPLLGMQEQNAVAAFGPQKDPYSEAEYIDMMRYALGDYASPQVIEEALRAASSRLTIRVDGPILNADGFKTEGREARAEIPFLRFATLAEPIVLTLTWKTGE